MDKATEDRLAKEVTRVVDAIEDGLARYEAPFVIELARIGGAIGFGRAQQILGQLWDYRHNCAPRGSMGVTVPLKEKTS